jgi:signal transduction histidine kinase/ActR/RegA family two-component response regulator
MLVALFDGMTSIPDAQRRLSDADIARGLAPCPDWSAMSESEHFVQFYEADVFLLDSLSGFIRAGLDAGDACIIVATEAHREGLDERLRAFGLDVAAARESGQFVALDAAETLSKFMVDGLPDPVPFNEVIGGLIASVAGGRPRVRAFGEMVALLWAEGNQAAAIRLEELWNDLGKTHPFSLFCAYPMHGFGGEQFAEPLANVCTTHSRVIPAESFAALDSPEERLRAIIHLQQKASSLQAEIAEHRRTEGALRAVKEELEAQVEERGRLLESERLARAEAETASRLKDEFLATVSHELRTPLNAIMGWSHMLRSGSLDEATATRALETIERNAQAQAQLVEDILDVSRVITGKLRLQIAPVDVASVINAAIDSVQLAADAKGIQLEVSLDRSARHVSGDAGRLRQVVWNLVSNAIKFTPAGGRVEVRLARADSDVELSVCDTGCGIGADFLPHVFDRFRQADGTSTRRHGGLGLGLAIVRHLVELHGGTVKADSEGEGRGSTFTVRLPPAISHERAKRRDRDAAVLPSVVDTGAHADRHESLRGVRVLVVDDDEDTLQMLSIMLAGYSAEVRAAGSEAEALKLLERFEPDVVVTDLAMPGADGYSLVKKLKALDAERGRHTPVVALTAYVRVEDRARALSAGFNMFVPKPVDPDELLTAIAHLAESGAAESGGYVSEPN